MSLKTILTGAAAALSFAFPAFAEIEVHDPYARSSNAMAGAAFMIIHNHGGADDRLIAARSDAAQRVELHTHVEDDAGVMRMIHVEDGFDLPTDGEIIMQRGGYHVMLMGLNAPFEHGETITVTLVFESAGEVVIEVPVDQERAETSHDGMSEEMEHSHSDHSH